MGSLSKFEGARVPPYRRGISSVNVVHSLAQKAEDMTGRTSVIRPSPRGVFAGLQEVLNLQCTVRANYV